MHQDRLRKWLIAAAVTLMGVTGMSAATTSITFSDQGWTNAQELADETVTSGTVTITFGNGSTSTKFYSSTTPAAVRIYGGGSVTISSTETITGMTLTFQNNSQYYPTGNVASEGTLTMSENVGAWSGSSKSVTLTRPTGSGHWRLASVEVTTSSAITVAPPTFNPESGTAFTGTSQVTISGPSGSYIYYKKNGTATLTDYDTYGPTPQVVTVDETMTISAIAVISGTASTPSSASYTVTTGGGGSGESKTYRRISSADELDTSAKYIIVSEAGNGAMGTIQATNYRSLISEGVSLSGGTATVTSDEVSVFSLGGNASGYTFYDGTYYLANTSNSNQLNSSTDGSANTSKWTITFSGTDAQIANAANTTKLISYYSSYNEFNCYRTSTSVQIYKEYTPVAGEPELPTLTADFTFWPEMNDAPSAKFTITPASGNTVYYTLDGTTPSNTHGVALTSGTTVTISGTTTVKAISYVGSNSSDVVARPYTLGQTVTGIGEFRQLASGTTARLYLPDDYNARVLFVSSREAYVRDNTGAMCIYNLTATPALSYNQHLAGWIIGTYTDYNGLPEFTVATGKTNTYFLAIAEPVTEENTLPVEILAGEYSDYLADWVTVKDLRISGTTGSGSDGTELTVYNKFNLGTSQNYYAPYDSALVDITGIAIPYGTTNQLAPIQENGIDPLTYVLDENQKFASPGEDISPVKVRLNRTLYADRWNTLTLPISITNFDGTMLEYSGVESAGQASTADGIVNLTNFELTEVTTTLPGVPYLVKPSVTLVNPVFESTTLSATKAQTVSFALATEGSGARRRASADGTYSLVGVYNPTEVETGSTIHVLDDNSIAQWTTSSTNHVAATSAYFATPEMTVVQLKIGDEIITGIEEVKIDKGIYDEDAVIYNILGQKMTRPLRELPSGVYIVNGIKVVK